MVLTLLDPIHVYMCVFLRKTFSSFLSKVVAYISIVSTTPKHKNKRSSRTDCKPNPKETSEMHKVKFNNCE